MNYKINKLFMIIFIENVIDKRVANSQIGIKMYRIVGNFNLSIALTAIPEAVFELKRFFAMCAREHYRPFRDFHFVSRFLHVYLPRGIFRIRLRFSLDTMIFSLFVFIFSAAFSLNG